MKNKNINKENFGVKHIAFIMDGNGRWAKLRGKPRTYGHSAGFKSLFDIASDCNNRNIEVMSVYAFSTENWNRPKKEVDFLWKSLESRIDKETKRMIKENIALTTMGDLSRLPLTTQQALDKSKLATAHCTGLKFNICLNYGGRDDIVRAVKNIIGDVNNSIIDKENINEEVIGHYLDSKELPDVDLLIRTSGEKRLSNYMLWQLSYAELIFNEILWPDYKPENLDKDLEIFAKRTRRFGGLDGK